MKLKGWNILNRSMLGIIDATIYKEEIKDLTLGRSMAAIPFAGRYRLIDFVLSNMVNSGIESVAIFPKYQYRSLMDHLGSGKQWDLNRKRDGLFFFPSPHLHDEYDEFGSFRQFSDHIDYFNRSRQKYAVITNSHTVVNIDFQKVLDHHIEMNCDITEVCQNGKSLQMYLLKTDFLMDLMTQSEYSNFKTLHDVVNRPDQFTICQYDHKGYAAVIDSIESYFTHSLELLHSEIWQSLFLKDRPIFTKVKDEPPTRYGKMAEIQKSFVANGCIIEGKVENSIIFRGVHIGKGTVVKNSIIMQKTQVGEGCTIENAILDKDVKIGNNIQLIGEVQFPNVIHKGTVQGALMNS
nr:sugar phosphate nucleotidyltransferase [Bacillus sp. FJAT-47783]